jgi:hypothetical protein
MKIRSPVHTDDLSHAFKPCQPWPTSAAGGEDKRRFVTPPAWTGPLIVLISRKKKGGRSRPHFTTRHERSYVALPANWPRVSIAEAHARANEKSTVTAPTFLMCLRTTSSRSFALMFLYSA